MYAVKYVHVAASASKFVSFISSFQCVYTEKRYETYERSSEQGEQCKQCENDAHLSWISFWWKNVFHLHLTSKMHLIVLMEDNCIVCCHYLEQRGMSSHSSGIHFEVNEGHVYSAYRINMVTKCIQAFKTNISIHSGCATLHMWEGCYKPDTPCVRNVKHSFQLGHLNTTSASKPTVEL